MDTDVLIVGAGPTGLMLANQLARRGVRAIIIDRHAGPARETRALGVQARTLEIYAKLGIVEEALTLGRRATGANLWASGRRMARVPLGETGRTETPYPFILILGQDHNERLLGNHLRMLGSDVAWRTELVGLEERPEHVIATVKGPDGMNRLVTARWIAGCDGAHSAVRHFAGIGFPGEPYEHVFFVADVTVTGTMVPDEVNVYLWRSGFHLFFPMRGTDHWRVVGILPAAPTNREGVAFDDVVPSLRGEAGEALRFQSCTWFSTYRIHHRAAERFRSGRSFLLGDAAHIHSPVGAQGMNTGLQDAYNLAWKLALVCEGRADAKLLDSYEAERLPVARALLATTDRAFKFVVADNVAAGLLRTQVIARFAAFVLRQERVQRFAFRTVSQIGIEYRKSALSYTPDEWPSDAPRAGDRFPWLRIQLSDNGPIEDLFQRLDDTRFTLLVIGQPASDASGLPADLVDVIAIEASAANAQALAQAGIPSPAGFLLRPDGYIALCGVRLDASSVRSHLRERLDLSLTPH